MELIPARAMPCRNQRGKAEHVSHCCFVSVGGTWSQLFSLVGAHPHSSFPSFVTFVLRSMVSLARRLQENRMKSQHDGFRVGDGPSGYGCFLKQIYPPSSPTCWRKQLVEETSGIGFASSSWWRCWFCR